MKILLGLPEHPPYHIGGGGIVFENLAKQYAAKGHSVSVMYGYFPTESWSERVKKYKQNGITFHQIPEIPYPKSKPFLRTVMPPNYQAWKKISSIISKENPDVIHVYGYGIPIINVFANKAHKQIVPYLFTIQGYPATQEQYNPLVKTIWKMFVNLSVKKALKNASMITGCSDFITFDSRNSFQEKSQTIYNGISLEEFANVQNNINIREKHTIPSNTTVIYSLGRISEMKGFQEVINILPKFKKKKIKVKYLIAGDDDGYKDTLENQISKLGLANDVEFCGFHDLETKKQYITQCDIYAVPSLWEPFGLVTLEGAIYNKPILTTDVGGIKEILKDYKNKINIYDKDVVNKILNFKPQKQAFDIERFSWSRIADQYLELLEKIAKK